MAALIFWHLGWFQEKIVVDQAEDSLCVALIGKEMLQIL